MADSALADQRMTEDGHRLVMSLLKPDHPSAFEYDQAAQLIDDELVATTEGGEDAPDSKPELQAELIKYLARSLTPKLPLPKTMERRLELVSKFNFKAILTTNYSPIFHGVTPFDAEAQAAYRAILRHEEPYEPLDCGVGCSSEDGKSLKYRDAGCPVMQLHGNLEVPMSVALTHAGYRRLINECPHYMSFLRSVLSTHTVLYVGFSFTDAYLNELRSEIVSMLGSVPGSPVAYAIVPNKGHRERYFYMDHMGTHMLTWSVEHEGYEGFDRIFEALYQRVAAADNSDE